MGFLDRVREAIFLRGSSLRLSCCPVYICLLFEDFLVIYSSTFDEFSDSSFIFFFGELFSSVSWFILCFLLLSLILRFVPLYFTGPELIESGSFFVLFLESI